MITQDNTRFSRFSLFSAWNMGLLFGYKKKTTKKQKKKKKHEIFVGNAYRKSNDQ